MKLLRIGVDVDGVLADFNSSFIERVIKVTGIDRFGKGYVPTTWNYPESVGYSSEEVSAVWGDIKGDPYFWRNLPPYEHTGQVLTYLSHLQHVGHDVYFITARPGIVAKKQTEEWLQHKSRLQYLAAPSPTVLISNDKGGCASVLSLDIYVDDRVENVFAVSGERGSKCVTFMFRQPWNKEREQDVLNDGIYITDNIVQSFEGAIEMLTGARAA
jgi:5'(3')-deoxyribonucleotidase